MANANLKLVKPEADIQFIDLNAQRLRITPAVDEAVVRVIHHGKYIMGPEVAQLETELAKWAGCKHALSCANGTDALGLVLMAKGVGAGDAVFVPAFTFVATAEVVAWVGATAYFVDVLEDSFNMDPDSLKKAIAAAKEDGLNPAAVIPVDLFGQPANYPVIDGIAAENNMWVMADSAQSFGASLNGKKVGSMGLATATSFFPAKPLGCYGDGGAVFTDSDEMIALLKSLRVHGQGSDKYDNVRIGMNGRLDTMQAAVLLEKLKIFGDELVARQKVADRYNESLRDVIKVPELDAGATSAWAQYTLTLKPGQNRAAVMDACKAAGVPTMVYYPIPLSQQQGYKHYPSVPGGVPVSERLAQSVFSLPMHPYLDTETQDYIIGVVRDAVAG
ncbi:DegT/DnrJ/EryC1/StrS family aminotransferase [Micavibrio aeruginosavorus]|uniref:DegT/DnrJ/EryC1/StrS family aminotransferase n=1 Tax=Micavibrio aeruginosavorus TaxID=349221 RepID=UPI003F4AA2CD